MAQNIIKGLTSKDYLPTPMSDFESEKSMIKGLFAAWDSDHLETKPLQDKQMFDILDN